MTWKVPKTAVTRLAVEHRIDKQTLTCDAITGRMKGFESEEAALREDATRIDLMRTATKTKPGEWVPTEAMQKHRKRNSVYGPADLRVPSEEAALLRIVLLKGIETGRTQPTLASSFTFRQLRIGWVGSLMELFEPYADADLRTFTIAHPAWIIPASELLSTPASFFVEALRRDLRSIELHEHSDPLVAWLHCSFDPVKHWFVFHFHGVTTSAKAKLLGRLTAKEWSRLGYKRTFTGSSAIRRVRVRAKDRFRQFSYLMKGFWTQSAYREVSPGKFRRDRRPQRIHEPYGTLALVWLNRLEPADLALAHRCKFEPNGLIRAKVLS